MTSSTSRTLHLVDLENLVGDPRADASTALATFDFYLHVARWRDDDQVIVATNPWLMARIAFDLPVPASRHAVHGHDGADLMLLSLAPAELVVARSGCEHELGAVASARPAATLVGSVTSVAPAPPLHGPGREHEQASGDEVHDHAHARERNSSRPAGEARRRV